MIFVLALALLGGLFVAAAVIDIKARRRHTRLRVQGEAHHDIYGNRHMRPVAPVDPSAFGNIMPPPSSPPPSPPPGTGGSF